jgi:hypothetical protein
MSEHLYLQISRASLQYGQSNNASIRKAGDQKLAELD